MFCKNCGAQLPENGKFCGKCGTSVPETLSETQQAGSAAISPPSSQGALQFAAPGQSPQPGISLPTMRPMPQKKKPPYVVLGVAACAVIVILARGIFIGVFSGRNNAGESAETFVTAAFALDYSTIAKYSYFDFASLIKASVAAGHSSAEDVEMLLQQIFGTDSIQEFLEGTLRQQLTTSLKDSFGDDYTVTVNAGNEKMLSQEEKDKRLSETRSDFSNFFLGDAMPQGKDITEICEVEVHVTITGSLETDTEEITLTMVKTDHKWLVLDSMEIFENILSF